MLVAFPTRSNQPVPRAHALLPIWTEFLEVIFQRPPPLLLLRRAPSRQCLDTKVYGRTTPATHEMIIPPPPPPSGLDLIPSASEASLAFFFCGPRNPVEASDEAGGGGGDDDDADADADAVFICFCRAEKQGPPFFLCVWRNIVMCAAAWWLLPYCTTIRPINSHDVAR